MSHPPSSGHKKTCRSRFFVIEHIAWRYVFERLAIVIEHTFRILRSFIAALRPFVIHVLLSCAYNMTTITKINLYVM